MRRPVYCLVVAMLCIPLWLSSQTLEWKIDNLPNHYTKWAYNGGSGSWIPSASCVDTLWVQLDGNNEATITALDIDNGSTPTVGETISSLSISQDYFTCSDIGANTVTLTVEDTGGTTDQCDAIVMVQDTMPPVLNCPGHMVIDLDPGACDVVIDFNVSASDNCDNNSDKMV